MIRINVSLAECDRCTDRIIVHGPSNQTEVEGIIQRKGWYVLKLHEARNLHYCPEHAAIAREAAAAREAEGKVTG